MQRNSFVMRIWTYPYGICALQNCVSINISIGISIISISISIIE